MAQRRNPAKTKKKKKKPPITTSEHCPNKGRQLR